MDSANVRWPNSLWAAVTPVGPELPELIGAAEADICGPRCLRVLLVVLHVRKHAVPDLFEERLAG